MTVPRTPTAALRLLLALLLFGLPSCSRKAERLVGNERLIRGDGGLGVTSDSLAVCDRDTWVETGTRRAGGAEVLVGSSGASEAVTLLKVRAFSIPDTNASILSIGQVALFAVATSRDSVMPPAPLQISIGASQTAWGESTAVWSDRGVSASYGQADYLFGTDTLVIPLNFASAIDQLKKWAAPAESLRFQLTALGSGMASFRPGAFFFRVTYDTTTTGTPAILDTPVPSALYLHAPLSALATGAEDSLRLGGPEGAAVALHFAVPQIPAGASIDAAEVRLRVAPLADSTPYLEHAASIDVEVREAEAAWTEGATSDGPLSPGDPIAIRPGFVYRGVADSLLSIAIPAATVRNWRAIAGTNRGLVLTVARGKAWPALRLDSRQSARPPTLRLTYTSPPRGRF